MLEEFNANTANTGFKHRDKRSVQVLFKYVEADVELQPSVLVLVLQALQRLLSAKTGFDEVSHAMFQTALRFCAFISTFASAVLLLEILGELPLPGHPVHTSMGDISFFIMIYWIVETISTVGYCPGTTKKKTINFF